MSRIRADQLVNRAGSGGPKFPHGVADGFSVSGIVTATSFRGDGSQLQGIDATALKDGSNVKVQATATGATVTGTLVATVTGNVTGNVTSSGANTLGSLTVSNDATVQGNLTVNGTTTTIDTAVTAVDSLAVDGSVGIGTTNATSALDVRNGIIVKDQDTTQNAANPGLQLKHNGTIYGSWRHDGRLEIGGQDANATIRLNPNGTVGINSTAPVGALDVGGNVFPATDNVHDLGSSSKRWANIYTGDLNLSNEGSANDVDGTWGQYTIQEGENDLFLINRRTGKKYKFNLTEVN